MYQINKYYKQIESGLIVPVPRGVWGGPTSGLVHRWQMDDASISGGSVLDLVGSLNATIVGGVTSTSSPVAAFAATARAFNGSTGYLTLGGNPLSSLSAAWSIGFWTNLPDITQPLNSSNNRFCNFQDGTNTIGLLVGLNPIGSDGGVVLAASLGSVEITTGVILSNNSWTHICATFDGASTYTLYQNGSAASTSSTSGTANSATNEIADRNGGDRPLQGSIYQFVTYNRALSPGEVSALFSAR